VQEGGIKNDAQIVRGKGSEKGGIEDYGKAICKKVKKKEVSSLRESITKKKKRGGKRRYQQSKRRGEMP